MDQKTRTVGHVSIDRLSKAKEWANFVAKSAAAEKVNAEHEQAKEAMRVMLKKRLELDEGITIDFTRNGERITITEILEPKGKRGRASNSLDDKF